MDDANTLECPHCHARTDSLKLHKLLDFTFLIYISMWKLVPVIGCPNCIRKKLGIMTLKEIFKANLLFPFYLLYALVMFTITFVRGHSKAIVA